MTQAGDTEESESGESRSSMGERAAHLITRDEARAWLAGSAVHALTVHRTDPASAAAIEQFGVNISRAAPDTSWGRGFYSSLVPDVRYGDARLQVAVRLIHPLVIDDTVDSDEITDRLLRRAGTDDMRAAVLAAGYDGVVVHFGQSDMWVVAYFDHQVRVIVESR